VGNLGLILFELNFAAAKLVIDKIRYSRNSLPLVIPDLIRDPDTYSGWKQDLKQFQWTQRVGSFGRFL